MFVYAAHSSRRRPGARSGGSRSWPAWRNGCVADAPQFTVLADGGGMSRDERMGICRGGARAILVSSESPVSRGHVHGKENKIEPAGGELVGGGALCPGLARFRDAEQRKTCWRSLSRALAERAAASHLISSRLASSTTLPSRSLVLHLRRTATTSLAVDTHVNADAHEIFSVEPTVSYRIMIWHSCWSMCFVNTAGLARAVLPLRRAAIHLASSILVGPL